MKTVKPTQPTEFKLTFRADKYIRKVFAEHGDDAEDVSRPEKFLIGHTLVFLGLATFEAPCTVEGNVETCHRSFKSTKALRLLMDREGLFIPFQDEDED